MLVTPGILAIISWVATDCGIVTKNNPMGERQQMFLQLLFFFLVSYAAGVKEKRLQFCWEQFFLLLTFRKCSLL
jgi:hypothetical protein